MSLPESTLKTIRSYARRCAEKSEYGRSCTKEQLSELIETSYQAGVQKLRDRQAAKAEAAKAEASREAGGSALIKIFPGIFAGLTFDGIPLMDAAGFPYIQEVATSSSPEKRSIAIMDDAAHILVAWLLSIIALGPSIMINLTNAGVDNPQSRVSLLLGIAWATLYFMAEGRILDGAISVAYVHFHKFGKYCDDGAPLDKSLSEILGPEGLALLDYYTSSVDATDRDDIVFRVQDVPNKDSLLLDSARSLIDIGAELSRKDGILSVEDCLFGLRNSAGMSGIISEILPFFAEPYPYSTTPTGILYKDITLSKSSLLHRLIESAPGATAYPI